MYNLQNLEVIRISPRKQGIFAEAKYNGWHSHFDFLIQPDGHVQGKTASGCWQEVTQDTARLIITKIRFFLRRRDPPIG